MRIKLLAGAVGLIGLAVAQLPAAAATFTPAFDFTGVPVSQANSAPTGSLFAYSLMTVGTTLTVTGLGEFDNGSLTNVSLNGGGDKIYIGSGAIPSSSNNFAASSLASVLLTQAGATQTGYWAFASISSIVLGPGTYWVAVVYSDPNHTVKTTSAVSGPSGVSFNGAYYGDQSTGVFSLSTVTFGPNFAIDPTPLPAALPLFAGGLGALGLLARRNKRKAALTA